MASTVAGSQAGDRNQALNSLRLHRVHEYTSGLRKQARPVENVFAIWRYSKRLNDRVRPRQRSFDRPLIKRISVQFLKPGIVKTY